MPNNIGLGATQYKLNRAGDMGIEWPGPQAPGVMRSYNPNTAYQAPNTTKTYKLYPVTRVPKGVPETFIVEPFEQALTVGTRRRGDYPNRPSDTRINGARTQTPIVLVRSADVDITWRIRPRWNTVLDTVPIPGQIPGLGRLEPRQKQFYINKTGYSEGGNYYDQTLALGLWLPRPVVAQRQTEASLDSEMSYSGKFTVYKVRLRDSANAEFTLGETLDSDVKVDNMTVEIPSGAATGLGVLWVESVTERGTSLYKDLLPVQIT